VAGSFDRDLINAPNRQSSGAPFEGQLTRATNDKIRLMKESELGRANSDFDHRIRSCNKHRTSDIRATAMSLGTITVAREECK